MSRETRVLMLEDTLTDAELAERELHKAGIVFTSLRVETRDAFIKALEEFRPDIVLSDYSLPDFDGMTALEIVRRDHPEVPVIMVTGALTDIKAVELIHAGAKDYVLKDGLARLASAVQRTLAAERGIRTRKATEKALRESEQQFRTLTENSPNIIMRYDRNCRHIYVNPAYERNTGIPYDKATGATPVEQWPTADTSMSADEYMTALHQVITSGIATNVLVEWSLPVSGELTSHDIHIVPEYGADGEISGALAIGHSVTALKRIERKLQDSHALLRDLTRHREAAREEERRHIARELHDELGQQLMALRLNVNLLNLRFGKQEPLLREAINALLQLVDNTIQVTRNVSSALRPAILNMGIVPALEWLAQEFSRHTGIACELQAMQSDICTQEDQAIALFRIAQETLTNAARHAQASHVQITFGREPDAYLLAVEDNGIGFDTKLPRKQQSYGLVGLHERALTVGGELTVSSTPGSGTVVRIRIPIIEEKGP